MTEPRLVLFDGNAIVHRAFHAFANTRPLTSRTGEIVSAVFGFAQMLIKAITDLKPTHYAIAFDKAGPTFRHVMYDQYKAHRPKTPEELVGQLGRVRQLVDAFHVQVFEIDGYEADDVLGTLCRQASEQGMQTVVVTGDADAMQLVSERVSVLYPKPRGGFGDTALFDPAMVTEKYGVGPQHITDLKAFVGDPSDNIPGVRGIGDKTAVKLIQQFGTVEEIYLHLDQVEPPRLRDLLRQNEAVARQSKTLATIVTDVPVKLDLDQCGVSLYEHERVTDLFRELGFASLLPRLGEVNRSVPGTPPVKVTAQRERIYRIVNTAESLGSMVARLSSGPFAFGVEGNQTDPMTAAIVGLSFSPAPGEGFYVPVGHVGWGQTGQLEIGQVTASIKGLMENREIAKTSHSANYNLTLLAEHGVAVNNLAFDPMVAAYLLSERSLGLKALAFEMLGLDLTPISELTGTGQRQLNISQVEIERVSDYSCANTDSVLQLKDLLETRLHADGLWSLFADVEMPLIPVLVHMQRNGVVLDTGLLARMSSRLGEQLQKLESDIYYHIGHQFNINSPQQLSAILFQELKLPGKRKGGSYTTGAEVLEELRGAHPVIGPILEYRQLSKLKSTYIDALPGPHQLKDRESTHEF